MYNSDGVLTFATGAFAPGVTVDRRPPTEMWAIDGGIKWNGLAINGQYFFRWVDDFVADGPLPLDSTCTTTASSCRRAISSFPRR